MKKLIFLLILKSYFVSAQEPKTWLTPFSSGVVLYNNSDQFKDFGFSTVGGTEYMMKSSLSVWTSFDFESVGTKLIKEPFIVNGQTTLFNLFLGANYFLSKSKVRPYLSAGLGLSFISSPDAKMNGNNLIELDTNQEIRPMILLGAGIQAKIKPKVWLFLESNFLQAIGETEIFGTGKALFPLRIGIKTLMM